MVDKIKYNIVFDRVTKEHVHEPEIVQLVLEAETIREDVEEIREISDFIVQLESEEIMSYTTSD